MWACTDGHSIPASIPLTSASDGTAKPGRRKEARESIRIQALLAQIGIRLGMQVWLPRSDRSAVSAELGTSLVLLDRLPLSYDEEAVKILERIDVLWLKGRSIRRAFEVEHTTPIYSGLLRMVDLLNLLPNLDVRLHIVAPDARRGKVFQEVSRPSFNLERGTLANSCSFIPYSSLLELGARPDLEDLTDRALGRFEQFSR